MKKLLVALGIILTMILFTMPATADIIDFESGYSGLEPVGVVTTATNTITFSVSAGTVGPGSGPAYVARVGTLPGLAFAGAGADDQVATPSVDGGGPG